MNIRKPFLFTFAVAIGLLAATSVLAWTGPSASAPANNATAPLNTSNVGQIKVGGLELNTGGAATGLIVHGLFNETGGISDTAGTRMDAGGGWLRTYGQSGWYNGTYGGGMYMTSAGLVSTYNGSGLSINTTAPLSGTDKLSVNGGNIEVQNSSSAYTANAPGMVMGTYGGYGYLQTPSGGNGVHIWNSGTADVAMFNYSGWAAYLNGTAAGLSSGVYAHSTASGWAAEFQGGGPYGLYVDNASNGIYDELAYSGYGLYTNGPVYAPAFYYTSDERLKKNIVSIASSTALQDVLALQPVTFNWKDPTQPTTTQLGFIAQQVEKVVPELVFTDASTTYKGVDYARVTPLLVGALQEQQAEINELKAEVAALKASK